MIDRRGLLAGAAALPLATEAVPQIPGDAVDALLKGRTAPGGFVAVTRGDRLVGFRPWGRASIGFDRPVTPRTRYQLGSVGKHVTALAVLRLAETGRVDLRQPIGAYVRDLPDAWSGVAVRHLLAHTGGLVDYADVLPDWDRPQTRRVVIDAAGKLPPTFAPGTAWAYSNTGYLLLGWLIADVSGRSYADYLGQELFARAGTTDARADAADEPIADRAEPYTGDAERIVHAVRMEHGVSAAADGGVLMSARDAAAWRTAADGGRLVARATLDDALRPAPLSTGRSAPYNAGWFLDRHRGGPMRWHTGGVPGFLTYWLVLPDAGLSVLAAANYDGAGRPSLSAIAAAALEAVAPGSTPASLSAGAENARSRALRGLLARGEAAADPALLAPELARAPARGVARISGTIDALRPVERYAANGGEMVRYRLTGPEGTRHMLAGWTRDDRLFWLA